ncbi:unnamed protein product [Phytophthora lilii]|uniref:Unnamed protein product n=1 Tax=Phytophthora lilii TaxID=2077276 RepID=A0A9W6X8M9_9STRA|nr:unnamed protein product [Phytophthora lilii]
MSFDYNYLKPTKPVDWALVLERAIEGLNNIAGALRRSASKLVGSSESLATKKSWSYMLNKAYLADTDVALSKFGIKQLNAYVEEFNKKHPKDKISLVGMLTVRFGDDAVARALVQMRQESTSMSESSKIATKLKSDQLNGWMTNENSVDDVFSLLKLKDDGKSVFNSPKLEMLEDYIALVNKNKNGHETLFDAFKTGVGGDSNLAALLQEAKADSTEAGNAVVLKLQKEQFNRWKADGLNLEDAMKLLQLDKSLSSPNLNALDSYATLLKEKHATNPVSLIGILEANYEEAQLANALVSASMFKSTHAVATNLQREQLKGWVHSRKSINDVFELLELGKFAEEVFELVRLGKFMEAGVVGRKIDVFDDYIALFNSKYSGKETLVSALSAGFGGENKLATILMRAKGVQETKAKADKLQIEQFDEWIERGLEPEDLLKQVFKVDENRANDLEKAVVSDYKKYYAEEEIVAPPFTNPRRT